MPHYLWRMSVRAANWETIRSQRTEQESAGVLSASDLMSRLTKSCPMKVKMDDTRAAGDTAPKRPTIPAQPAVSESHFVVSCRVVSCRVVSCRVVSSSHRARLSKAYSAETH